MTKAEANRIAQEISIEDINRLLIDARKKVVNWNVRSKVNKSFTIANSWNIFSATPITEKTPKYVLGYIIREFSEFLPSHFIPNKTIKTLPILHHSLINDLPEHLKPYVPKDN